MIESVEKQKRILDYLERWAKNCRIKWLLRENDLNCLSWVITDEFYNVTLSCCHRVRSPHWEFCIETDDWEGTTLGSYCLDCARSMLKRKGTRLDRAYYGGEQVKGERIDNILKEPGLT